ncbi:MAG TPA: MerR family transcriptional regulator, partial [Ramlibacter sp.]
MLTSKEIIERTGISRATLNNYIASGLVPRPQVLPPGPEHGAAPRIGYFPDDTIARVEAIQRLKREGWSIARIAEHLVAHPPGQGPVAAPAAPAEPPAFPPLTPVAAARSPSTLQPTL